MGQKVPPGLFKRGNTWHVQKVIGGVRVRESCGTSDLKEAERYLAFRTEQIRNAQLYGVRPDRTFREAATRHLEEATKASINRDVDLLRILDPFIGDLYLQNVHMGTLKPYIDDRKRAGWKKRTINYGLQVTRRILNLAASEWIDETGKTWIDHAAKIKLLREDDRKRPYPLLPAEQARLFAELPEHLRKMALFKVNTGCREAEVCSLRWDWEIDVPALGTSVFIIPDYRVKNREDRLVVLNRVAASVVDEMRGMHAEYVFTYHGHGVQRIYGAAWRKARERAGLPDVRVHDLKHTFGRRLRAAGVSFEDRQDLLGHKSGRITTHYSGPELRSLIEAANKVCSQGNDSEDMLTVLRRRRAG